MVASTFTGAHQYVVAKIWIKYVSWERSSRTLMHQILFCRGKSYRFTDELLSLGALPNEIITQSNKDRCRSADTLSELSICQLT